MLNADPGKVSSRAKKLGSRSKGLRLSAFQGVGLPQLGTLGAGNHYAEIQAGRQRAEIRSAGGG